MRTLILAIVGVFIVPGVALAGDLHVTVAGVQSADGNVLGVAFDSNATFLQVPKAKARCKVKAAPGKVVCTFHGLTAGRWAISAIHDANDNSKLDRNSLNIPTEGYGFSNDAEGVGGPPTFDQAAFDYDGQTKSITIDLDYPN
jgi:uncharacterized protein (DUF2141 family)